MKLFVKKLDIDAKIPSKSRLVDEGYDLYSNETITLHPMTTTLVKTGIAAMCDNNHWLQIEARSGLAAKSIFPIGGIIDYGYTGPICVLLSNLNHVEYIVNKYDRIAQLIIRDMHQAEITEIKEFNTTERGNSGFGSSGN